MATKQPSSNRADEEYIDMELSSSSSNFFSYSIASPPQTREFEFQMTSVSNEKESTTFPADELFYKGKLLPLHLPPRLKMVQNLEHLKSESPLEENCSFHLTNDLRLPSTSTSITPLESCTISPSESCRVSSELNPDEYLFDWSTEMRAFLGDHPKKSWFKKLKQIKQFSLCQKLKASRTYLKSLFRKSDCSDRTCANAACSNVGARKESKGKDCLNKCLKVARKNPFDIIDDNEAQITRSLMKAIKRDMIEDGLISHRKSFSGVIQRHSANTSSSGSYSSSSSSSSSSSFSFSSNGFYDLQLLKRSSTADSEIESSIEGAIAHCKQSQHQLCSSRRTANEIGFCSLSASRIAASGDLESPGLCGI
ncbi:Membrane-associated kinase regulator 4 [Quillaja saponaria]|uniref:Membrane-associated kinase regulator 4 n=1 Tax=Quillaja saponaria TaxID=32244 RepID=A0AAD7Q0I0_QUISA|nr:Membrane-associated kinase regulator 4 [Quillaja saponaria]